jgi:hypothetical protein
MLLDDLMPQFDVVERHRTVVRAAPDAVYGALREANLASGLVPKLLIGLRALPAALLALRGGAGVRRWRGPRAVVRLADLERRGFCVVAERPPEELVIGLLGRYWTFGGGLLPQVTTATFRAGPPPGYALAGWNFTMIRRGEGITELRTETRVLCAVDSRWKFRLYWLLVRPGSGLIRRGMLRAVRCAAEAREARSPP